MGSKLSYCCSIQGTNSDTDENDIPLQDIDDNEPNNFNRNLQRDQQIRGDFHDF